MNLKTLATLEFDKVLARLAALWRAAAGCTFAPHPLMVRQAHHERVLPQPLVLSLSKDEQRECLG